jgi:hypothetical protein
MQDKMNITILEDGTIKVEVDKVSMPNHASAEQFLKMVADLANGGKQDRTKKGHGHSHSHSHADAGHSNE